MLPLSAPGVCFRQKPDVDYALPPSREAISLLSSGVLWGDDARLPEDDPVRVALELRAEEDGVECDFVRRDPHDAERVEELPSGLAELLREHVVRGLVVEDSARVARDVAGDEVDVVLRERVEGHAVEEDAPLLAVLALDVRLLRRAVGVAVEQLDAAPREPCRVVLRVGTPVLDHVRVGELRAVVGYQKFLITDIIRNPALSGISDAA